MLLSSCVYPSPPDEDDMFFCLSFALVRVLSGWYPTNVTVLWRGPDSHTKVTVKKSFFHTAERTKQAFLQDRRCCSRCTLTTHRSFQVCAPHPARVPHDRPCDDVHSRTLSHHPPIRPKSPRSAVLVVHTPGRGTPESWEGGSRRAHGHPLTHARSASRPHHRHPHGAPECAAREICPHALDII